MKQNSNMYNITDITVEFDSIDLKYEMFDSLLSKYLINFHQFLSENKTQKAFGRLSLFLLSDTVNIGK